MNSSEQESTSQVVKSVQETSKRSRARSAKFPKSDLRYWQEAIFQNTYSRGGEQFSVKDWAVKIQHLQQRHTFSLSGLNKAAAAMRAKEIYAVVKTAGWEAALGRFKPRQTVNPKADCTVGEFLSELSKTADAKAKTLEDYSRALRQIVADIADIDSGTGKYDHRSGGRVKWLEQVHSVKLSSITPEKVQRWKRTFMERAGTDAIKLRRARSSVNSLLRRARSLFSKALVKHLGSLQLPTPLPFDGINYEQRPSSRYRCTFDIKTLGAAAFSELKTNEPEQFKVFLLAAMAGLRRSEIDNLEWTAFRWSEGVLRIEATKYFEPKTEGSHGDVDLNESVLNIFQEYMRTATGRFVIESRNGPKPDALYAHYRCQKTFDGLIAWLRRNGLEASNPLHTLRKEFGSIICARAGLYAASRALRHADIYITASVYIDKKTKVTVDMDDLQIPRNVIAMSGSRAEAQNESCG